MLANDSGKNSTMLVAVRLRPFTRDEGSTFRIVRNIDANTVHLVDPSTQTPSYLQNKVTQKEYQFDLVFGPDATQVQLFEGSAKALVQSVLAGYNSTVFAYGATGAGKTYTIQGSTEAPGLIANVFAYLFEQIEGQTASVKMS